MLDESSILTVSICVCVLVGGCGNFSVLDGSTNLVVCVCVCVCVCACVGESVPVLVRGYVNNTDLYQNLQMCLCVTGFLYLQVCLLRLLTT